jgi:hypothetical protein
MVMDAEYTGLLHRIKADLKKDLDDLAYLMKRKEKDYINVCTEIGMLDVEIPEEPVVIDCVDVDEE